MFTVNLETILLVFGPFVLTLFAAGGVLWRLWMKKLQAEQAHELAMKQLDLQAPPYLAEVDAKLLKLAEDLSALRGRLEKSEKAEKAEKKAAAFGDNFDANANADADEAPGNLSKLKRTIRDRKTTLSPIKK